MLFLGLALAACSDGGGGGTGGSGGGGDGGSGGAPSSSSGSMGGNGGGGGSCDHACPTTGTTQCNGTTIESCAPDANGCRQWVALLDCGTSGKVCDDGVTPAACTDAGGPTCSDATKNQDETDIDCGGATCDPCGVDKACGKNEDCASKLCQSGTCKAAPSCNDGVKNASETDVDCGGGQCPACPIGESCQVNGDCTTNLCNPNTNVCAPLPTCDDGTKNQDETDVDCGGATCKDCADGEGCMAASDCVSGNCNAGTCAPKATCGDGTKNQDETDVDCGGAICAACPLGGGCADDADCLSGSCNTSGTDTCVAAGVPTCDDGVANQDETDVDCGGAICDKCALGETCELPADCVSGVCDFIETQTCIDSTPSYQTDEDFETGDYKRFPYGFAGPNGWAIETNAADCHAGSFCARTSPLHAANETSSFDISLSVRKNMNVTFWAKTNTEPGQHFFRFYVDGVKVLELSGQNAWKLYSFPVQATGPNGPNRVLKWEYTRSNFVDPNHVPWNQVWVDDIDMPEWNTEPSVPKLIRPWNGKLTSDTTPTFQWQSFDPDFDPITYQMEWDTSPSFPNPSSTGEIQDTQYSPPMSLLDNTIYYWRVRAKDNSNYRWSAWSQTWATEINTAYEYAAIWRQTKADQFKMNDNVNVVTNPDDVTTVSGPASKQGTATLAANGGTASTTLTGLPTGLANSSGTLTITASGDFDGGTGGSEFATVRIDGTTVGTYSPGICNGTQTFNIANVASFVADGSAVVSMQTGSGVDAGGCSGTSNQFTATLSYTSSLTGTMVSVPINFSLFEGKKLWEKVQVVGTGNISVQVLDAAGMPIPDSVIPGNAAGHTARTIRLWDLSPVTYPEIRLKATLFGGSKLEEWTLVGNDVHEWLFSHAGDAEGWTANDKNAAATLTVANGVLRLNGLAAGIDPNIQYMFPKQLDATRFKTIEVRVRTSNNNQNDDPTIYWDSNYGSWDKNRSFTHPGVFLVAFQDLSYDLTKVPPAPGEPWQGMLNGIRVDPAVRFLDTLGQPADGWFEIERIAIY
ncbi:hypothetical protein [Polyangium aurulentum]|uniref:hypothetical protein n=1 Tax=Polyangium aurulentum TaxID=2567896 RepID=UPI002010A867|nr:hypothetical protein [Polyangium aurulentum]UQA62965.1 hypothetical protein E8A73_021910 [Polyangium aurulentum]